MTLARMLAVADDEIDISVAIDDRGGGRRVLHIGVDVLE
jgi:hypothetical protein